MNMIAPQRTLRDRRRALHVAVGVENAALKGFFNRTAVFRTQTLPLGKHGVKARPPPAAEQRQDIQIRRQTFEEARPEAPQRRQVIAKTPFGQQQCIQNQTPRQGLMAAQPVLAHPALDKILRSQLGEGIPQPVPGPAPLAPVMHELQRIGVLVDQKPQRRAGGAAGRKLQRPEAGGVDGAQLIEAAAQNILLQAGQRAQLIGVPQGRRRKTMRGEQPPVIGDIPRGVLQDQLQAAQTPRLQLLGAEPLIAIEFPLQPPDRQRSGKIPESEVQPHIRGVIWR